MSYVHERDECYIAVCLLKSRLSLLEESLCGVEVVWSEPDRICCLPDPFIAQSQTITLRHGA
jgi:hypothetical protein